MQSSVALGAPDEVSIAICRSVVFSGQPAHDSQAVVDGPAPSGRGAPHNCRGKKTRRAGKAEDLKYKRGDDPEAAEVG